MRAFSRMLLDILYPPICLQCEQLLDAGQRHLCSNCWQILPHAVPATIMGNEQHAFESSVAAFDYSRNVQRLIHFFKYRQLPSLAREMGEILAETLGGSPIANDIDLVVPVPLHPLRLREREYNQAAIIAEPIAHSLSVPLAKKGLERTIYTPPQASMDRDHRFENVKHAFKVHNCRVKGKTIAVVDDVLTTGNTLNACAHVLKAAQAQRVVVLTVARVSRQNSRVLGTLLGR